MIPIIWHHADSWWDCALPKYLLRGATNDSIVSFIGLHWAEGIKEPVGVIVIPGRHSCNDYAELNKASRSFEKVVWIIIGDEEGIFHSAELNHPDQIIWWLMPPFHIQERRFDRVGPNGWPEGCLELLGEIGPQRRIYDWSFAGQLTHIRRVMCVDALQVESHRPHFLLPTAGFTQGLPRREYYEIMARSKLVLCPSGPCTPDSFRFAEALEAGCIPIVDDHIQHAWYPPGYWKFVCGELLPFPIISDWQELPVVMEFWLKDWERKRNVCQRWWNAVKSIWINKLKEDLCAKK